MLFAPSLKLREQLIAKQLTCEHHNGNIATMNACDASTAQSAMKESLLNNAGVMVRLDDNGYQRKVEQQSSAHCKPANKTEEVVEAMKKLDAKLIAYLAGEDMQSDEDELSLKRLRNSSPMKQIFDEMVEMHFKDQQMEIFKRVTAIRLQMEALTLQPEGTKRMDLLQSEIRPIFTVECQLSNELIKMVPRYEMFHVMQFESEKFQSLTQCTRFGMEAQRNVKLQLNDDGTAAKPNFGRIHFTLWWREPGTCLNEMLGMGVLDIDDLYNASLLEQCKCITINRRGIHLANVYLKISLIPLAAEMINKNAISNHMTQLVDGIDGNNRSGGSSGGNSNNSSTGNQGQNATNHGGAKSKSQNSQTTSTNPADKAKGLANSATNQNNPENNNFQVEASNFSVETTKVRLLKGYIYVNQLRNVAEQTTKSLFLVCRRFWHDDAAAAAANADGEFHYSEQFAVINDEEFLQRVEKQHLRLEVIEYVTDDNNGNNVGHFNVLGIVRLPLHQFYIAYRDATITNHLCKGKLPVISIDNWVPILKWDHNDTIIGELNCLLAIGSDEQIIELKMSRELRSRTTSTMAKKLMLITTDDQKDTKSNCTSELLGILEKSVLAAPLPPPTAAPSTLSSSTSTSTSSTSTSSLSVDDGSVLKLLQTANGKSFKFVLNIQRATGLPVNPSPKGKKGTKRNVAAAASKRFPPNEPPSTYVTFQADEAYGNVYKSHEGMVYATNIVEKSTEPCWSNVFRVTASIEYLTNPQQRFILKIWKKSLSDKSQDRLRPTPLEDAIIGFAALDLTVFLKGLHIGGWFNIVDFNGRITGKLEIRCEPLEDIRRMLKVNSATGRMISQPIDKITNSVPSSMDDVIEQFEFSLDLTYLNLGQAIAHKFKELEGIDQRLRRRLRDITGEQYPKEFNMEALNNWQPFEMQSQCDDDGDGDIENFLLDIATNIDLTLPDDERQHENNSEMENTKGNTFDTDADCPKKE